MDFCSDLVVCAKDMLVIKKRINPARKNLYLVILKNLYYSKSDGTNTNIIRK
ncbi:MAG: hypothetical protein KIG96_09255 [Treponema sp.]|nr:hypothetical protein [Treponema sp.]